MFASKTLDDCKPLHLRFCKRRCKSRPIGGAWPDLLRQAGSLELGRVKADAVVRLLQVKERPTPLARALAELGRIVKTIHVLVYPTREVRTGLVGDASGLAGFLRLFSGG